MRPKCRPQGGFTLVEVVIVVTILGLVIGAITGTLVLLLRTEKSTPQRLDESRAAQGLTTYFPVDVQNAPISSIDANDTVWRCALPKPSAPEVNLLTIAWKEDVEMGGQNRVVAYWWNPDAADGGAVTRYTCAHPSDPALAPASALVVSRYLNPTFLPPVSCLLADGTPTSCSGTTPVQISMQLEGKSGYRFTVTGARVNLDAALCKAEISVAPNARRYLADLSPDVLLQDFTVSVTPTADTVANCKFPLAVRVATGVPPVQEIQMVKEPNPSTTWNATVPAGPHEWVSGIRSVSVVQSTGIAVGSNTGIQAGSPLVFRVYDPCRVVTQLAVTPAEAFLDQSGALATPAGVLDASITVNSGCDPSSASVDYLVGATLTKAGDLIGTTDVATGNVTFEGTFSTVVTGPAAYEASFAPVTATPPPSPAPFTTCQVTNVSTVLADAFGSVPTSVLGIDVSDPDAPTQSDVTITATVTSAGPGTCPPLQIHFADPPIDDTGTPVSDIPLPGPTYQWVMQAADDWTWSPGVKQFELRTADGITVYSGTIANPTTITVAPYCRVVNVDPGGIVVSQATLASLSDDVLRVKTDPPNAGAPACPAITWEFQAAAPALAAVSQPVISLPAAASPQTWEETLAPGAGWTWPSAALETVGSTVDLPYILRTADGVPIQPVAQLEMEVVP